MMNPVKKKDLFNVEKRQSKEWLWLVFAISASLLLHLTATRTASYLFIFEGEKTTTAHNSVEQLRVEFEPLDETTILPYIEANPNAPENKPDDPEFDAARDQQAAQTTEPVEGPENAPTIEGEEDANKIVEGSPLEEQPLPPAVMSPEAEPQAEPSPPKAVTGTPPSPPAPDFYNPVEDTAEGPASLLTEDESDEKEPQDKTDKTIALNRNPNEEADSNTNSPQPEASSSPAPLPRPRVTSTTSGPLRQSRGSAPKMLDVGVSARFTEYGDYLQRMFETIDLQWQLLVSQVEATRAEQSTMTVVRFELTQGGEVQNLHIVDSTTGRVAALLCLDAIKSTAPFGNWTADMVNVLNETETITIRFRYR